MRLTYEQKATVDAFSPLVRGMLKDMSKRRTDKRVNERDFTRQEGEVCRAAVVLESTSDADRYRLIITIMTTRGQRVDFLNIGETKTLREELKKVVELAGWRVIPSYPMDVMSGFGYLVTLPS